MNNYKNKGANFQAQKFTRYTFNELWEFTNGNVSELIVTGEEPGQATCILKSKYGNIEITEGDYVFPDSTKSAFYANPPDYFGAINEMVARYFEPPTEIKQPK